LKRFFSHSAIRFVLAGGINTFSTYLIYCGLVQLIEYRVAYTVSFVIGLLLGYFINTWWVFKKRPVMKSAIAYPLAVIVQYLLGIGLLSVLVELGGVGKRMAPIVVALLMFPIMYIVMKLIFSRSASKND
jgi:putative flippase GtrA